MKLFRNATESLLFCFCFLLITLCFSSAKSENVHLPKEDLSPKEIVKKSDEKLRGTSNKAVMSMKIIRPEWERTMSMKSWSKGNEYALILITAPAKDKGTVSLKRENELWNWMPSIERTIKVSPSMMSQSWMGSDFTNDDLLKESSIVEDYNHTLIGEENVSGFNCYKIEMKPKPDAPVVWGKIVLWVSKEEFHQVKAEYYDEDEYLINVMQGYDPKQMGDRVILSKLEMIPADEEGHKTVLIYEQIDFDVDINENFFSLQNMRRVR
ncbi:MAG: outer membrane lipoprotein-sorting protein [Thalassobius sp.]|nr:outer membrane lipoprotein-sorting protein [Thalassovita sp.]